MCANQDGVIGVLQIVNAINPDTGEPIPFTDEDNHLLDSLASQAAIALANYNLIQAQEELMDSFIKVIAGAIDAKSPYTGGHCERVPELSNMLAEATVNVTEGPYKNFTFNEEEWKEFKVAGWLHDCGKVTTPEYVVDKDTKLSTIYNRIHEVRLRFEVLRRDAEIEYLKASKENPDKDEELLKTLHKTYESLDNDFNFVAECNVGGEFMSDEYIDRLTRISKKTWVRNYDDRLGLSEMDLSQLSDIEPASLPCTEDLLADKSEHIIKRTEKTGKNEVFSSTVPMPKYLFNRGELLNLSIRKGTLTAEDRYIINDHIVQTIIMLKKLPFPPNLKRVTEYAGGHHEKMDGTGYPMGLTKEELSIPARIIAIADIFEALTACDRPYKKTKTLTESLKIMSFMVKDQHIDKDLFSLFLETGIYQQYADKFLNKSQIDEVNIADYL